MHHSLEFASSGTHLAGETIRLRIEQSDTEFYTAHSGLALVSLAINRHTSLVKTARSVVKRHGIPNIELLRAYVRGQIAVDKSDFDALELRRPLTGS